VKISPQIDLPKTAQPQPSHFDSAAREYLLAAEMLWSKQKVEEIPVIAPLSQCLATGIELFLKARLLTKGYDAGNLRIQYGHDIYKMWMLPDFAEMRRHAQDFAEACVSAKKSGIPDPQKYTVNWTVEYLSKLYGKETFYALRYPSGVTQVPYAQPLLWVMYELLDDPRWDGKQP
jgi:hypothetical protein